MKTKKSLVCLLACLCVGVLSFGFACDGTTPNLGTSENSAASSMENNKTGSDENASTGDDESSVEDTSSNVSKGEQVTDATAWEKALENAWGYDFIYNQHISYVDDPSLFYSLQLICENSTIWMRGMGRDSYEEHRIISYDTLSCSVWKDEKCYVYGKTISDGILVDFQDWTDADDLEDGGFNGKSFEDVADEAISETLDLESELEWYKSLYANVTFDENEGVYRAENFENKGMQVTILIKDGKVKKIERSYTTQSTENPDGKARTYKESLELGGASEILKEVMPQFPSDMGSNESSASQAITEEQKAALRTALEDSLSPKNCTLNIEIVSFSENESQTHYSHYKLEEAVTIDGNKERSDGKYWEADEHGNWDGEWEYLGREIEYYESIDEKNSYTYTYEDGTWYKDKYTLSDEEYEDELAERDDIKGYIEKITNSLSFDAAEDVYTAQDVTLYESEDDEIRRVKLLEISLTLKEGKLYQVEYRLEYLYYDFCGCMESETEEWITEIQTAVFTFTDYGTTTVTLPEAIEE